MKPVISATTYMYHHHHPQLHLEKERHPRQMYIEETTVKYCWIFTKITLLWQLQKKYVDEKFYCFLWYYQENNKQKTAKSHLN